MTTIGRNAEIIRTLETLLTTVPQDADDIAKHVDVSRTYVRQCLNLMAQWGIAKKQLRYQVKNRFTGQMRIVDEIDRKAGDSLYAYYPSLYWKD